MFDFFKKKKPKTVKLNEESVKAQPDSFADDFISKHNYKMEHDPKYRESFEQTRAFLDADREAREKAGLANKPGSYTFICPNCGSKCRGEWVRFDDLWGLHGHTGCLTCNIHIRV